MERYTFTRPKTKSGNADFYNILIIMANGHNYNAKKLRKTHNMTMGSLIYKGLCKCENKEFKITESGRLYVDYVASSNKPLKAVMRSIINHPKG